MESTPHHTFYKRTRKGKVVKIVREKYLRDDLDAGYLHGKKIDRLLLQELVTASDHKTLLVIDTNIALHQIDALEYACPVMSLIVIPQTVLQELKHLNLAIYKRLFALFSCENKNYVLFPNEMCQQTAIQREKEESPNDFNDRAIVKTAEYFRGILASQTKLVFITNDKKNQERAALSGINTCSMRKYAEEFSVLYPQLIDLIAADFAMVSNTAEIFLSHCSMAEIMSGLNSRKYFKGVIRCKGSSPYDCYVVLHTGSGQRKSVVIRGMQQVNRAVDGDLVAVKLETQHENKSKSLMIPRSETSTVDFSLENAEPTPEALEGLAVQPMESTPDGIAYGVVVGIIRRNWRQYAGSIDISRGESMMDSEISSTALFKPVDPKIPNILIMTRHYQNLKGKRLLVTIDEWPVNSSYPYGHYVSILGDDGDRLVETQVVLHEFQVPHEAFSSEVMACLPSKDWKITEDIIKERMDLRHIPVVSIDPPGCKDIDDALHCIRLPNGRLEAGVHIADVTHFVEPDSPLDKEASHRSTSTYLVDRRLDMLPGYLTTQLCSLRSSEDHLAFSVLWEMDDDGNIYDVKFTKSVIHSVASLTYDEAQIMLDNNASSDPVAVSVNLLNKLAKIFRQKRIQMGALTLASAEVRFKIDESQNPSDVVMYALKEANALVEEWMLLANITVSKQILRYYPTLAILRRHQPPSREQFLPLLTATSAIGINLDISSSKTLADTLDYAVRDDDPNFNKIIRILCTRCMMPAQYFCSGEIPKDQWHHYGLAAPVYTHFTSPIRRYADILVHRLLAASIGVIPLPVSNCDRGKQQDLCAHMNRRHRAAQHASRASVNLHTFLFFKNSPAQEIGYILSVTHENITVFIPRYGIEGSLIWKDVYASLNRNFHTFDPKQQIIKLYQLDEATLNQATRDESILKSMMALTNLQVFSKVKVDIRVECVGNDEKLKVTLLEGSNEN